MGEAPAPARIDQYRIVKRLAMGGMAEILLAVDEKTGRDVALKRILPQIASDEGFLDRFFHEIRIQISLRHRNIVELLDCSPSPANAYIVMEYVDGGTLQRLRLDVGRLPWELALFAADETLRGLSVAHKKGIVHRDIKPQNIMWTTDGTVKVADFGISQADHLTRLTVTGTVVGTPSYMSPEQARGELLDARSDLFSLGTVLYELMTGTNPFQADSVAATLRRVVDVPPDPPSLLDPTIPPAVDGVFRKLMAKDRQQRYASAEEASAALREILSNEGILHAAAVFRAFVAEPMRFVTERNTRLAAESTERARRLMADRNAAPEQALWAAYQTLACQPDDPGAQELYRTAATRVGQREKPVENPKIRELETLLRNDPENLQTLLQLAKLYRLEKDFLNLMRFFRKLQVVAPPDAYTQGQIAALVGGSSVPPAGPTRTVPAAPTTAIGRRDVPVQPAAEESSGSTGRLAVLSGAILLVVLSIWWWRRPKIDIAAGGKVDEAKVGALINLIREGPAGPADPGLTRPHEREDDLLQKTLEKGVLVERESGTEKAIAHYRAALARTTRPDHRAILLLTIAEAAAGVGDRDTALHTYDEVIAANGPGKVVAQFRKAELLEKVKDDAGARAAYGDLLTSSDAAVRTKASLKLAMVEERLGDTARALALYEEILAWAPSSPQANPARLGAAALYRMAGRSEDARRLYEEVKSNASEGSDFARSADAGLKALE